MDYKQLAKDIGNDQLIVDEINHKYELIEDDWLKLYQEYINFPVLKNNRGYNYVANDEAINKQIINLKKNISQVEFLIKHERDIWVTKSEALNYNLVYKSNGVNIPDLVNYANQYKVNYQLAQEFILNNELTIANISKLWEILGQKIIDFHPVQNELMYRAVEFEIYNHQDRILTSCTVKDQITDHMDALIRLAAFDHERDEYANLLIAILIKINFLQIAPFYRFNEQMADLICLWFLKQQKFHLYYFPTNYLLSFNSEILNQGLSDNRFSYREQDVTLLLGGMLAGLNNYLTAFKYLKKASDILISDLDILTNRERDYLFIVLTSHFKEQYFNWEMLNDELKKIDAATTKAGVLKILNRLEEKKIISSELIGRSKMFKINS